MNGFEFYLFLLETLLAGQVIAEPNANGNIYNFLRWLDYGNNGFSLQFDMHNGNIKSIPRDIIVLAKDAYNANPEVNIDGPWLIDNDYHRGSCAASVLRYLLENY